MVTKHNIMVIKNVCGQLNVKPNESWKDDVTNMADKNG
jgi:hypothetical protein